MEVYEQEMWCGQSDYYLPSLGLAEVGKFLAITEDQVLLEVAQGRLDEPLSEKPAWSSDQIYRYVLTHQPRLQGQIPRLYPFDRDIGPARFLFSQSVSVQSGRFAVHAWQPADQRGALAMAYPTPDDIDNFPCDSWHTVDQLLAALPWASLIAVPSDQLRAVRHDDHWEYSGQPYVIVAESGRKVTEVGWFDIANLVRCDLPYWSEKLREHDAIMAWQPGAPIQAIATTDIYCPAVALRDVVTTNSSPQIVDVVERAIGYQRRDAVSGYANTGGHDSLPERPGLFHAAVADVDWSAVMPTALSEAEQALLLHQPYNGGVPRVKYTWPWTAIEETMKFTPATAGPLVDEWASRLQPADHIELGHAWLCQAYGIPVDRGTALRDPLWPDQWILACGETFCNTVSFHVPAASGRLVELFAVDDGVVFFRDSADLVWPMPSRGQYRTGGGPTSTGSDDLVKAVANLVLSAYRDVRRKVNVDRLSAIWRWITTAKSPLHIPKGHPALSPADFTEAS